MARDTASTEVDRAVAAILGGRLVVMPTDTVYGLVCTADREQPARDLYRLKGRAEIQPTAVAARSVEYLLEAIPELSARAAAVVHALLPGPYTLVVPNPARRFAWLGGESPDAIGVRVPALEGPGRAVIDAVGAIVATSANLPGGSDPRRVGDVPEQILAGIAVLIDGGELPGAPSTVIDITAPEPRLLRAGAGDPDAAMARIGGLP